MIICICASSNEREVVVKASDYVLKHKGTVDVDAVVKIHHKLGEGKSCGNRCGQCLPATATLVKRVCEHHGVNFDVSALNRDNLITTFKNL